MVGSVALMLDTSLVRDLVSRESIQWDDIRGHAVALASRDEGKERKRCTIITFKDEIQTNMLSEVSKLVRKQTKSVMSLFAIEPKLVKYETEKKNLHRKCQMLEQIRTFFGLKEDCKEELDSDAFLLITACAEFNSFRRIVILTSDKKAYENIGRVLNNLSDLADRIEVKYLEKGNS